MICLSYLFLVPIYKVHGDYRLYMTYACFVKKKIWSRLWYIEFLVEFFLDQMFKVQDNFPMILYYIIHLIIHIVQADTYIKVLIVISTQRVDPLLWKRNTWIICHVVYSNQGDEKSGLLPLNIGGRWENIFNKPWYQSRLKIVSFWQLEVVNLAN